MSGLVKFDGGALPAYLVAHAESGASVNKDVFTAAAFPSISIKGKVFTLARDGVRKPIMKPGDDGDEVAQSIGVVVVRANMKAKTFYMQRFSEDNSEGLRPDCYSYDGDRPSPNSPHIQATRCAICKQNEWGSRTSQDGNDEARKGKACSDNARLAIATPDSIDQPMLIRVPPASLKNLREAVKVINTRKIPYNAVVMKIAFDHEAASPKLTFKPIALVEETIYRQVEEAYDSETVRAIVGVDDLGEPGEPAQAKPAVDTDELDAAIAAREVTQKAARKSGVASTDDIADAVAAPAPAPAAKKAAKKASTLDDELEDLVGGIEAAAKPKAAAPAPAPAPAPAAKVSSGGGSLLDEIDDILGSTDD